MSDIHINRVKQAVASAPGTGIAVLGSAQTGFQSLGAAQDGKTVSVLWLDGADWEIATGCTYTDAASTLSRGTREDSSTGARLSLTSAAVMAVIAPASRGTAWDAAAGDAAAAAAAVAALATVATSGDYADLAGTPTLGTAAAQNTTAFATAAQGTKADGAAQVAGDLGGTPATPVVAKINGVAVTGTPTAGQVPTATSGTAATWQTPAGGGGTPGGSSGQMQYNNAGAFGGAANISVVSTGGGTSNGLAVGDSGANPGFVSVRGSPSSNGPHGLRFWPATDIVALVGYDQGTTRTAGIGFLDFSQTTLRMAITCMNGDLKTTLGGPLFPKQYTTATRPAWVNGAVIFDTDLDKLVIGGASAWEAVTSV